MSTRKKVACFQALKKYHKENKYVNPSRNNMVYWTHTNSSLFKQDYKESVQTITYRQNLKQ